VALIVALLITLAWSDGKNPFVLAAGPDASAKAAEPAAVGESDEANQPVTSDAPAKADKESAPKHTTESLRGKIVWLAEALKERYGIESDADAAQTQIALATADGLYPLVKDNRGRGFWIDPRLRDFDLELVVRRYQGSPVVQVVRVYSIHDGRAFELDYWCDICSIPMYEMKDCECCQGQTRFRERPVDKTGP